MRKHYVFISIALLVGVLLNVLVAWFGSSYQRVGGDWLTTRDEIDADPSSFPGWAQGFEDWPAPDSARATRGVLDSTISYRLRHSKILEETDYAEPEIPLTSQGKRYKGGPRRIIREQDADLITLASGWPMRSMARTRMQYTLNISPHFKVNSGDWVRVVPAVEYEKDTIPRTWLDRGITLREEAWIPDKDNYGIGSVYFMLNNLPTRPLPLGFAVNSVVWSLPLLLPALFFACRRKRRQKLGHCLKCGYDAGGLDRCPECGRETATPA